MKNYEITFEWPNGDWTWIYAEANDFHQAMLVALDKCPLTCRVHGIVSMTPAQIKANRDSLLQRAKTAEIQTPPEREAAPRRPARAKGGHARAQALTPERREAIARDAANARWHRDDPIPEGDELRTTSQDDYYGGR